MNKKDSIYHHLFDLLFQNVQDGIAVINSQGKIEKCNHRLETITGLFEKEIIGLSIEELMPGLKMNDHEFVQYQIPSMKKEVVVRKKGMMEGNNQLEILLVSETTIDIKLTHEYKEIKWLNEMYETVLNSIDEGIHFADENGYVRFINPAQEKLDGYQSEDIIGKHWTDIYDLTEGSSLVLKALHDGKPILDRFQNYVTRNGKYVSIVASAVPLYFEGRIIGAAAITKDFIKFKEIADKILQIGLSKQEQSKSNYSKKNHYFTFDDILGESAQILESIKLGRTAAQSESPVFLFGETGTGKEMFAQSIHMASKRTKGPFLAINCAAIPENLLEGILFGTTKGVFTGAIDRKGLFEQANGGTLFLDEINSMSLTLQSKLLRVLQEKKIMRLGGNQETSVDVRIISSCNIEPIEAVEKGQLRSDLFYRLAVIYLPIPPLRDRLDDLDLLIGFFIQSYNHLMNKNVKGVHPQVLHMFRTYQWPGNIRQLKHCLESAMNLISFDETFIRFEHIPQYLRNSFKMNSETKMDIANETIHTNILGEIKREEKENIIDALKRNNGNVAKAAEDLGMSRQRLHYRLKKYNLK
ncbi:sigma 54-interacting transcriptional regulator [Neobacillus niacini]|uniref:sigma 54-interacting transcriptional regulator n=1 Tax=Neobacillus niacini TaxID=86668 RepID=UPI002856D901|nr:sigma 54-interacting transcriptional regulator [Neobacillus niacini]MDR7001228.1 arginine utilization regulatory protein [Neobacillus niacini]